VGFVLKFGVEYHKFLIRAENGENSILSRGVIAATARTELSILLTY
jgi:hypothetical protein